MTEYRYLIGFISQHNGALRYASVDVTLSQPIVSGTDVRDVQRRMRVELGDAHLMVLAFSQYVDAPRTGVR
jgi:hypothetical protein